MDQDTTTVAADTTSSVSNFTLDAFFSEEFITLALRLERHFGKESRHGHDPRPEKVL